MPHFTRSALEADPESLDRLFQLLHGRRRDEPAAIRPAPEPSLEARFGVRTNARGASLPRRPAADIART